VAPKTGGAARDFARELADRERELDACSQAIYGRSHAEFCDKLYGYAFAQGHEQGLREGWTAGRRAAKGLKTSAKKRGRPLEIDEGEKGLLIDVVGKRKPNQTIKEAVTRFLLAWQVGNRYLTEIESSSDHTSRDTIKPDAIKSTVLNKGLRAYYRHRPRKKPS
jgi:hypothetical protein